MQIVMETIIYILAIIGIIITITSFYEMFTCRNICSYRLFNNRNIRKKRVDIVIHIKGFEDLEEEEFIDKIMNGNYDKLDRIADSVRIQKD